MSVGNALPTLDTLVREQRERLEVAKAKALRRAARGKACDYDQRSIDFHEHMLKQYGAARDAVFEICFRAGELQSRSLKQTGMGWTLVRQEDLAALSEAVAGAGLHPAALPAVAA